MANDSYLRQLTRNVVLTSLLAGSVSGVGCSLHNTPGIQQNSIDVKMWRMGNDALFVEYDKSVFSVCGMLSLQGEDAGGLVDRISRLGSTEEVKPELLKKSADLLAIINSYPLDIGYFLNFHEGEVRQLRLNRPSTTANYDAPKDYIVPIPTQWSSIRQVQDYYKKN